MRHTLLWAAYLTCLEIGRRASIAGDVTLLPIATGLLLVAFARAPRSRWLALAGTTVLVTGAWAVLVHGEEVARAVVLGATHAAGALAGSFVLGRAGLQLRTLRRVADTLTLIRAAVANAVAASAVVALAGVVTGWWAPLERAHVRLVTDLLGVFIVVPLVMAGRHGLVSAARGRLFELFTLLTAVVVATHFMWSSSNRPWPGLLAPFFVWGILRFPQASSLVNVAFQLTAVVHLVGGRDALVPAPGATDGLAGLWLHLIVCAAFLVMSAGVLERRRSQWLMARVLDGVSDGIIVLDVQGVVQTMNRSAAAMFGYDQAEAHGMAVSRLWSSVEHGAEGPVEVTATRRDGSAFPARLELTPVPADDEGHTLALVRDLSRQRQTEQSLAMREAQWAAAVEALSDVVLIHDQEGQCVEAHVAPHATLHVEVTRLVGRRITDILTSVEAAPVEAARTRVLATRAPTLCEFRVTRDDRSLWFEARIVPLGDDRTLSVVRDVTERHALQDERRQAQRLEAIGRLAGGVAHDFNNLLTVIGGSTELVLETLPANDAHYRALQDVRHATARAAQLTQQLLAFGRRQMLQAEVFDLAQVVRTCEQMLRRVIGEHIELVCRFVDDIPRVQADRGQIEQVIVNLAVNARDAMPKGGLLTIKVDEVVIAKDANRFGQPLRPGRFVRLTMSDTGTGIPPEVVEHIFEPFFTTKAIGQGTGLGLATVHGIVEQSDGFITVESREHAGTTFDVYLPAVDTMTVSAPAVESSGSVHELLGDETILVVEDEDGVREVTARFLTTTGYQVLSAGTGTQALDLLRTHNGPVHLLLTDVVMPGMSGPELVARAKARYPDIRALFMSGYPNESLQAHHVPNEPTALIQKPFSRQALVRAVQDALRPSESSHVERSAGTGKR